MAYSEANVIIKLKARRDAILDELAALTSSLAGGKPNSQQGGIDHVGYKDSLYRELAQIEQCLATYADPFEICVEHLA